MILKQNRLEKAPYFHEGVQALKVEFGEYNEIGKDNYLENVKMGSYSYTGQYCFIQNARIGKFANLAAMVRIGPTDHPMERASLHHFTYRAPMYGLADQNEEAFFQKREERITEIGHDTWIGHGSIIKPGLRVGNGAVVGAGTMVTKDIPPYAIVVGNPGRILRYRFDPDTIGDLEDIQWWDWTYDQIKENFQDFFLPIGEFVKKHRKEGRK